MQRPRHALLGSVRGGGSGSGGRICSGGSGGEEMLAVVVSNWPRGEGQAALLNIFRGFAVHPNGVQIGMHGPEQLTDQVGSRPIGAQPRAAIMVERGNTAQLSLTLS